MPREHPNIKMDMAELKAFLGTQTRCSLGTLDAQGGPWGDFAACCLDGDELYFRVPTRSRSFRHIVTDNRVVCSFESHPADTGYYTIKGAIVHGKVRRGEGALPPKGVAAELAKSADPVTRAITDGAIFSIGLDDYASFDFAKIKRRFEQ